MKGKVFVLLLITIGLWGCKSKQPSTFFFESDTLKIQYLSKNTYLHVSYLNTDAWGKVACNGMVFVNGGEAIVLDAPTDDLASEELINWLENTMGLTINAVVATHFHEDCLGGLKAFHLQDIPSYALNRTLTLAEANGEIIPQNGFDTHLELKVGREWVKSGFWGEGHTKDNVVCYVPSEKVLFGGCLIKSQGAGKGNLNDANSEEWSNTVRNIKTEYSEAQLVIPGHGRPGNSDLFDYTINLFSED